MRIGATVIVHSGRAYQSYGWSYLRPLGDLQRVIDGLEELELDEICLIRLVKGADSKENVLNDMKKLKGLKSLTPLSFGGGLRDQYIVDCLSDLPFERFVFSSSVVNLDVRLLEYAAGLLGRQALIGLVPFVYINNTLLAYDCKSNNQKGVNLFEIKDYVNEILLYDCQSEGLHSRGARFNFDVLTFATENGISKERVLVSGGISRDSIRQARTVGVAGCYIENTLLYSQSSLGSTKK